MRRRGREPVQRLVIDEPLEGAPSRGAVFVRGWAYVPGEGASLPEASIGPRRLEAALWREARPDAARALPEPEVHGFAGWIDLGDAEGGTEVTIALGEARKALPLEVEASDLRLDLRRPALMPIPTAGQVWVEAEARDGEGAADEVRLEGAGVSIALERSGTVEGSFGISADVRQARSLAIVAQGRDGARRSLPLTLREPDEEQIDIAIERIERRDGSIRLAGYVLWPTSEPVDPRVSISLDGAPAGEGPAVRSRPDVSGFWNPWGVTARCGFDLTVDDDRAEGPRQIAITAREDGGRTAAVEAEAAVSEAPGRPPASAPPAEYEANFELGSGIAGARQLRSDAGHALLIVHRPPDPDGNPGARRAAFQVEALLAEGWKVTIIADQVNPVDERARRAAAEIGVRTYAGPRCIGVDVDYLEWPERLIAASDFDFVSIHWFWIAAYFLPIVREAAPRTPVIFEAGALDFVLRARRGIAYSGGLAAEDGSTYVEEVGVLAAADLVTLTSTRECELAEDLLGGDARVHHVPVSRPSRRSPVPGFEDRRGMLFIGNFEFWPNVDSLDFLCDEVLPLLDAPASELTVAGFHLDAARASRLRSDGCQVLGAVPRLAPHLDAARVLVVPLLCGSGITNKVLDGVADGVPVVTTSIGVEGLEIADGEGVLVADDPADIAAAVDSLLTDAERWRELSRAALAWAAVRCSPEREAAAWGAARDAAVAAGRRGR